MKPIRTILATGLLLGLGAAPMFAQDTELQNAEPGIEAATAVTAKATVQNIDPKNRTVTLKGQNGKTFTVNVGPEARNFNQIRKGDQVTFRHEESLTVALQNPHEPAASGQQSTLLRAPLGAKPAGMASTTTQVTATVEKLDPQKGEITLRLPDGKTRTIKTEENNGGFEQLKQGDQLTATLTEIYMIEVNKPNQ